MGVLFAGIVQGTYPVARIERAPGQARLEVLLGTELTQGLELGASVAVDGVCLTVVAIANGLVQFDVIAETLALTTLGELGAGDRVNIERSLRLGDEVGGHHVSGHVMAAASIRRLAVEGAALSMLISLPQRCRKYVLFKGFVAVDGCSLTVGEVEDEGFWIHLIPETRRRTTLGGKGVGSKVNLEPDPATVTIVETVERVLAQRGFATGA